MNTTLRAICLTLALSFIGAVALTGCREPGPAEQAGREVDEAVEGARDALEDLGDETDEALEELEEEID